MKIIINILRTVWTSTPSVIRHLLQKPWTHRYEIIKTPNKVLEIICELKPAKWDKTYYPELYMHSKEQVLEVLTPAQYAYRLKNARVSSDSDVIVYNNAVYWDKYNEEEFLTWADPCDSNVMSYTNDHVKVCHGFKTVHIKGKTLSLLGTNSHHWAHFIFQYVGKLFYAGENGLLNGDITVIYNCRADSNMREILNNFLIDYPHVHLMEAQRRIDYICEELISIPPTYPNFNAYTFRLDYKFIIPDDVVRMIDKYIVSPNIAKVKNRPSKYDKIFLPRGLRRNLNNYSEIHNYFLNLGFVDIEGSEMTIEEKADVFYHAKIIVAILGASSQNLIFCNKAKVLMLSNYRFVNDGCVYTQARSHLSRMINVAGQDDSDDFHSNFTIPLEKVVNAYNYLLEM